MDLTQLRGNLNEKSLEVLGRVFENSLAVNGKFNAIDFRAEHDDWMDELDRLEQERYIVRERDDYRVTFFTLQLLETDINAQRALKNCHKIFDVLRNHYKSQQSRLKQKLVTELALDVGLSFDETVSSLRYLDAVAHLWCGGRSTSFDDATIASVIPSEYILKQKSFQDILDSAKAQFAAYNIPPSSNFPSFWLGDAAPPSSIADLGEKALSPDAVVLSFFSDVSSDFLFESVTRAGLDVDWKLDKKEDFSHKTRVRAYLPRIQNALRALDIRSKFAATAILTRELLDSNLQLEQNLAKALSEIGWSINNGKLVAVEARIEEMFFSKGSEHDAYVKLRNLFRSAKSKLVIIDPYVDGSLFTMLKTNESAKISVEVLTAKLPSDFELECTRFLQQHARFSIDVRRTKEFHDRFVVIDGTDCYHIGASIKDAGDKAFMLSRIEDAQNVQAMTQQFQSSWASATVV